MPFAKGHKKYGGMKKGFVHSQKQIVRQTVESALKKSIPDRLIELLETADPEKEIQVLLDLMPYCYPKLQAIEVSQDPDDQSAQQEEVKKLAEWLKRVREIS